MKNMFKVLFCLSASLVIATTVVAAKTELYSLDGRSLFVDENQVEIYTAEGMGWFLEKPVTMYSADGRTIVVTADQVAAYKAVGWFLEGELNAEAAEDETVVEDSTQMTEAAKAETTVTADGLVAVKYTDGTVVNVPDYHVEMYKALGWSVADGITSKVVMYSPEGVAKEVDASEVAKYQLAGWTKTKSEESYVTLYYYDGTTKSIQQSMVKEYNEQGWFSAYDEAVYSYAAFGDGKDVSGATQLLEDKKYELAFNMVQDALDKIENTDSEYVSMLYYLRTMVTDTWRSAANSPLGFINYWFTEKDGKWIVVFEYRNVSNSRIQSFKINFDICNEEGEVIETNSGSYYVSDLQMVPCEKKRVAWLIQKGDEAKSIKNLKVNEVVFSDNTKWTAAN